MRRLNGVKSRTKFNVATAVLIAAMLAFVRDASAKPKFDLDIGSAFMSTERHIPEFGIQASPISRSKSIPTP
jgi:hypothetical protein